jgi:hypothetical protein
MNLVIVSAAVTTALGLGYVTALFVPLNLFQATVIVVGATGVCVLVIGLFALYDKLKNQNVMLEEMSGWEVDDGDCGQEDEQIRIREIAEREVSRQIMKAMQKTLCSCGSGRKFRYCCMKNQDSAKNSEVIPF